MRKLTITILLSLIFISCASKKYSNNFIEVQLKSFGAIGNIEYKINKRYFTEKVQYYASQEERKTEIKQSDWNKIKKEIDNLDLVNMHLLDSPSKEREFDGAWYAQIIINTNNNVYETKHYDAGNPNLKLAKLDSIISHVVKLYSSINSEELFKKAWEKQNLLKEEELKNRIYPYEGVQVKPEFPGGNLKMIEFIDEQKKELNKVSGQSIIYFVISEEGKINDIQINADNNAIKNNSLDIMKSMPKWKPGIHYGRKVKVRHFLRIKY